MNKKIILFDLDGTLLPMDEDVFTKYYFKMLAQKVAPLGYAPDKLVEAIWLGVHAMATNDGSCTNEDCFWKCFSDLFGKHVYEHIPVFESFYQNEFQAAKAVCGRNEKAIALVHSLKEKGYRIALATNPVFPAIATYSRIAWAGLKPDDFEYITTYENSCHGKPNPDYYQEVLDKLQVAAEDCIMIGNNVEEDMIAETLGMDVFLLTDCLINRKQKETDQYPQGDFDSLTEYLLGK